MRQRLIVMCHGRRIDRNAEALRHIQRRELPQSAEQALGSTAHEDDLVPARDPDQRPREQREVRLLLARWHHRELVGAPAGVRGAQLRERAHEAARLGG